MPSVALREVARAPVGLLEEIVEMRAYARAKSLYDGATTVAAQRALPPSPLIDLAREFDFKAAEEDLQSDGRPA